MSTSRPRRRTAFTALCGAAALLLVSGCGSPALPPQQPAPAGFNSTDLAWLQLMVPMTENAVDLLRLTPEHSDSPALTGAAAKIAESEDASLARLHALRDRAGLPASNVHEGHRMPGMVTPADLIVMHDTRGAEFDQHRLTLVSAHIDPPMRPLFVDFPEDEAAWEIEDQFLLGPDVLIAPVLQPGATSREVYLPVGPTWAEAATGRIHSGGTRLHVDTPIDRIPVFLRAGTTLPIHS